MSSAQIDGCKAKIKDILRTHVFEYPLYESELIKLIQGEFPEDVIRSACSQLYSEGYIVTERIGLDENNHEYVFAIDGVNR